MATCNFKEELNNIDISYYKFRYRDLTIKRACHHCKARMDYEHCMLLQIYRHRKMELQRGELLIETGKLKKQILHLRDHLDELIAQKEDRKKEIIKLEEKIKTLHYDAAKFRAIDFLRTTIGEENYFFYVEHGYFDVRGTNNAVYRITKQGKISKHKIKITNKVKHLISIIFRREIPCEINAKPVFKGQIKNGQYPLEDAIAIVYVHIMKDSKKFDIEKGCGDIHIY